ncbi:MAG TPA: alpha-amylase family glycosyl hydrolase [Candidatus Sulfotelmatobacter sp.]|nr:alpha-amylase family glycosyl hydrolase [Candidatus Sulfotelmatobacter sp.]
MKMRRIIHVPALVLVSVLLVHSVVAEQPAAHPVADWIKSAVIYEVNPRTFSATGDLRGVERRLDYLKDLGVTVIWIMPIHPVGQAKKKGSIGSAYAVQDYYAINPSYGTKEDLKHLVTEAHQRGLKVIIDIVANHTAWDSVMMKHPEFYKKDAQGNIIPPNPDWSDVAGLDYRNPQLRRYMIDMLKYWLKDFDLDGFRCDAAGEVPTDFWEAAEMELVKVKPDIILIAESNKPELLTKAFDLDYAWPFHSTMTDVLENGAPAQAIIFDWQSEHERYPKGALEMRFSDNHDEKRAIARFGERGALAASALVFTMDGVPMLYNGMEVGDTTESGAPALFEKLPVFWPIAERRPNFLPFYKQMIALRKTHPALQQGETEWVGNAAPERVLTFFRRAAGEEYLVAINVSNRPYTGVVDVPAGDYADETPGLGEAARKKIAPPVLVLNAWDFRIYRKVH